MVLMHTPGATTSLATAGLPRYRQIANALRDRIHRREWATGDRLPGEETLAAQFKVSKLTMRQALSVLLNEGLILREHGKGTFVTDLWQPSTLLTYTSRMEDIGPETSRSSVQVLDMQMVGGPLSDFADLRLEPGHQAFRLRRVHLVDDSPRAYVISYLPLELAQRLEPEDFQRIPLILGIEERTGRRFPVARQSISASLADDEVAHLLAVPLGSPILLFRRTYFQEDGQPGYVALFRYPGSQFHFEVQLNRTAVDEGLPRPLTPGLGLDQGDE